MAIFGDPRDLADPTARGNEARRERKRLFGDAQAQLAGHALEQGAQLLEVMRILPAALLAAGREEHARIVKRYDPWHPRARELERTVAALTELEHHGARGRVRAERLMRAAQQPAAFQGFVSDGAGEPLADYVVRIEDPRAAHGGDLSARTDEQGWFRIALPRAKVTVGETTKARAAKAKAAAEAKAKAGSEAAAEAGPETEAAAPVEILGEVRVYNPRGQLVYTDPIALRLDNGGAYREYLIDGREAPPAGKPTPAKPGAKKRKAR